MQFSLAALIRNRSDRVTQNHIKTREKIQSTITNDWKDFNALFFLYFMKYPKWKLKEKLSITAIVKNGR